MIARLYTRNTESALGIEIQHLDIATPGTLDAWGDVTQDGTVAAIEFTGTRADTDFCAAGALEHYDENDLWWGDLYLGGSDGTLEDFLDSHHKQMLEEGWVLLPGRYDCNQAQARILAKSHELYHAQSL
ncbi:hypothetical protein ACIBKY_51475 [Nonomuraea sp. NPDC050394]|uniref:hypothetical protein n=1 Tax=Nonomuraea sp. NPDC050394 TaxID=3364363 RepID=UPI00378E5209